MATRFVNIDRDTPLLLPADMREWVPENHLSHFIVDAVEQIDTRGAKFNQRGCGSQQSPPSMLLALLIYSYSRMIITQRVSQAPNDKQELVANVKAIDPVVQSVETVLVDSGFVSEEAVKEIETPGPLGGATPVVLAALRRESHHRSVADLEKKANPPAPEPQASFRERMEHRVASKEGRTKYTSCNLRRLHRLTLTKSPFFTPAAN